MLNSIVRPRPVLRSRHAAAVLLLAFCPACLVMGRNVDERKGTSISATTLEQVAEGDPESFVLELLGEPSRRIEKPDGVVLLAWDWERRIESGGSLLFVAANGKKQVTGGTTWVRLANGLVTRAWQDAPVD